MIITIQRGNEKASKTAARNVFRKGKKAADRDLPVGGAAAPASNADTPAQPKGAQA